MQGWANTFHTLSQDCTMEGLAQHLDLGNAEETVFIGFNGRILCLQAAASKSCILSVSSPSANLMIEFHEQKKFQMI